MNLIYYPAGSYFKLSGGPFERCEFNGPIDCDVEPDFPRAQQGDFWVVRTRGKIGGEFGVTVEVDDVILSLDYNQGGSEASVGQAWEILDGAGSDIGPSGNAVQYSSQSPTVAQGAQARANLSLVPTSGKMIYVSTATTATDTRTSLSAYDPAKPFATLGAAKDAASSGDTIYVRPGTFNEENLLKNGVNWHFEPGAVVTYTGSSTGGIFDDSATGANGAVTCKITGHGEFTYSGSTTGTAGKANTVNITNASSNIELHASLIHNTVSDVVLADTQPTSVYQSGGVLRVFATRITAMAGGAVWWLDGEFYCTADNISNVGNGSYAACYLNGAANTNGWVTAHEIKSTDFYALYIVGATTGRSWVDVKEVKSTNSRACSLLSGKNYIRAEKISGGGSSTTNPVLYFSSTGEHWVNVQKLTTTAGAPTIRALGSAIAHVDVMQIEVESGSPSYLVGVQGATASINLRAQSVVGSATTTNAISISNGTLRVHGGLFNTSANSSGNPIVKSGGTLILHGVVLVAESTRDSIDAATAQNVVAYASYANKAVDSDVTITITGGLTVDADVV